MKDEQELPAFVHTYHRLKGHKVGVIQAHPQVTELLMKAPMKEVSLY
jgi:DNA-directed RNA polymerase